MSRFAQRIWDLSTAKMRNWFQWLRCTPTTSNCNSQIRFWLGNTEPHNLIQSLGKENGRSFGGQHLCNKRLEIPMTFDPEPA
jgi:hypothetical protein